jgi:hypothetical protein
LAKSIQNTLNKSMALLRLRGVAGHRQDILTSLGQQVMRLRQALRIATADGNACTFKLQALRCGQSNAARPARHDGYFA